MRCELSSANTSERGSLGNNDCPSRAENRAQHYRYRQRADSAARRQPDLAEHAAHAHRRRRRRKGPAAVVGAADRRRAEPGDADRQSTRHRQPPPLAQGLRRMVVHSGRPAAVGADRRDRDRSRQRRDRVGPARHRPPHQERRRRDVAARGDRHAASGALLQPVRAVRLYRRRPRRVLVSTLDVQLAVPVKCVGCRPGC